MESRTVAYLFFAGGAVAIAIGLLVLSGALRWFGHLPGDLHYNGDNLKVYAPIGSMLLISVLLSLALAVVRRLK
ncbi:MAG TPA: DUF2905 domain-containing protein [Dehalococcoidia bacterium]|nr:DUF2905 domain-containing protein [Dehalococcoidia bacterium]